jgi:NAD(P)-dependent dehydrogenase (short-subunit alcohol dehydrogenase family)
VSGPERLDGQVALVSGGGRGIGRAIARALGAAGASVAVLARSAGEVAETVALIEQAGGRARACPADATRAEAIAAAVAGVERTLGPLDLLVNCVATLGPIGPFWETDLAQWWGALDVVLRGPLVCVRAVLPGMIGRRRGRIVNVASGGGAMAIPYLSGYVTGKTALIRVTECLAAEAQPYGVALFAIEPGTVRTAMAEQALESPEGRTWLPWFRRIFDGGFDVPAERAARLVVTLAAGTADRLSGRFLTIADDLERILAELAQVEREQLYSLRVRRVAGDPAHPARLAINRAAERPREASPAEESGR